MNTPIIRREIPTEVRILDDKAGVVEYVASDESLDSYHEVIRANGWRFNRFAKNAPFVDSHRYDRIEDLLGQVVDYRVDGKRLVETVQWAIDVSDNQRARIGWAMTRAGYLRAVSVGFAPLRVVSRWDQDKTGWLAQLKELGLHEEDGVRAVYVEQEQLELSAVIIGANPNALLNVGRAFKCGALTEDDVAYLGRSFSAPQPPALTPAATNASSANVPGRADDEATRALARQREAFARRVRNACGLK